jgi:phosphoribosylformylglycinamidine synthase subunit PurQ / glutaminase
MRGTGGFVLGICNGFQVLTETGLLPGALMRNAGLKFVCRPSSWRWPPRQRLHRGSTRGRAAAHPRSRITTATMSPTGETLARLEGEGPHRLPLCRQSQRLDPRDIAGILSANRRVLGMMPHPERAVDTAARAAPTGAAVPLARQVLSRRRDPRRLSSLQDA